MSSKSAYLWIGLACKVCARAAGMKAETFLAESVSFYIKIKERQIELVSVLKFLLLERMLCGDSSSVSKSLHAVRRHLQNIHLRNCLEKIRVNLLSFCQVDSKYAFFFFFFKHKENHSAQTYVQSRAKNLQQHSLNTQQTCPPCFCP